MYTSGTTGRPKGVMIEHLSKFIIWCNHCSRRFINAVSRH
ncbi:AMP-binding protein [Bacillus velezensis]